MSEPKMTVEKFLDKYAPTDKDVGFFNLRIQVQRDLENLIRDVHLSVVEEIEKEMITHPEDYLFYVIEKEKWQQFKARIKEEK